MSTSASTWPASLAITPWVTDPGSARPFSESPLSTSFVTVEVSLTPKQKRILADILFTGTAACPRTTMSATVETREAVFFGPGEWDKVSYRVSLTGTVSIPVHSTPDAVEAGMALAGELAYSAARESFGTVLDDHCNRIKCVYYRALFESEDATDEA